MAKDPAFLCYYKDILVSTADWDADELGWYMRLLCHQADKPEGLTTDVEALAALAGVKFSLYEKFLNSWSTRISKEFITNDSGLLINLKQAGTLEDRRKFKDVSAEKGLLGWYVKIAKREILALNLAWDTLEQSVKKHLKETISSEATKEANQAKFKLMVEDIQANPTSWTNSIYADAIGNANGDANANTILNKGGVGENKLLCHEMIRVYKEINPTGPIPDDFRDMMPSQDIALYIFKNKKFQGDYLANQKKIIAEWEIICGWISKDTFYSQKGLKTIANYISEIFNKTYNGTKENRGRSGSGKHQVKGTGGY